MTKQSSKKNSMPLLAHLAELRKRIFRSALVVFLLAIIAFNYSAELMHVFMVFFDESFNTGSVIGTRPAEAFVLRVKLALLAAVIFATPYLFYELWKFVSPGLTDNEKKLMIPFVSSASLLFVFGAAFAYFCVLPIVYSFFASQFELLNLNPTIQISEHLDTSFKFILCFALMFELPVLSWILARAQIINYTMLKNTFRYAVVFIFIIAAVLTPPDVISQFLMAGPLLILYLLSMQIVRLVEKKELKNEN